MEYQIIKSNDSLKLMHKVSSWIEKGWLPLGGVSIAAWREDNGYGLMHCQAIVKASAAPESERDAVARATADAEALPAL